MTDIEGIYTQTDSISLETSLLEQGRICRIRWKSIDFSIKGAGKNSFCKVKVFNYKVIMTHAGIDAQPRGK